MPCAASTEDSINEAYLKLGTLKAVVSSSAIDHTIHIQIIQGSLERLHLHTAISGSQEVPSHA